MSTPGRGDPSALLLLLLDSRAPSGGHSHSAGMEPAIAAGWVRDLGDVEQFCRGRLVTTGRVAAGFAAAACDLWASTSAPPSTAPPLIKSNSRSNIDQNLLLITGSGGAGAAGAQSAIADAWADLDAEFEARTPSEAVRAASRQLGNGLLRLVRSVLPDFVAPWADRAPHHPIVLGAAVAAAGGDRHLAARAAALNVVSAPASAAVRLLGLDPFATQAMLARLAAQIDADAGADDENPGPLPADSAPALDLLADFHLTTEVRLFAS